MDSAVLGVTRFLHSENRMACEKTSVGGGDSERRGVLYIEQLRWSWNVVQTIR